MKHSLPVLVASTNEEFRSLLREMLGKHGFFHVLEASDANETLSFFKDHSQSTLSLIHQSLLNDDVLKILREQKQFLVIAQPQDEKMILWTAQLGVKHFMTFPFSSERLLEKINSMLQ
jgi:DNA-binding NtrC family response regulator